MSEKEGRDFIYLIWKDSHTRRQYVVGELSKNGKYEFSYGHEVKEAIKKGFELLIPFNDLNKTYSSDKLFSTFSSRLPDNKRRGIEKILAKYDLDEYDEYRLLKRSGAKLPIDDLQFIDPIFADQKEIRRMFYLAGPRHYIGCEGNSCDQSIHVQEEDILPLELEPTNKYDTTAIKVINSNNELLGYVPRYFSKEVTRVINNRAICECKVIEVNKENNCNECIKVALTISQE